MNKDRLWIIGGVAGILVVVVMGWFLGVSPLIDQTTAANTQAQVLAQGNVDSETKLVTLKKQYDDLGTLQSQLAVLRRSIPTDSDLPGFLAEINTLCKQHHVSLISVKVNDATLYQAPVVAVTPTVGADGSTTTPTPTPTATAAASGVTTATVAPTGGLVLIPVIINVQGSFSNVMAFTGGIQTKGRLYMATEVAVAPATSTDSANAFSGTLTGSIYTLGGTSGAIATSAPSVATGPAVSTTPSATPTDTPSSTPATSTPSDTPTPANTTAP
jgi:Tfp pilus assembly protein PilO